MPGFGEPPRNNQEFEIKILKNNSNQPQTQQKYGHHHFRTNTLIEIKEDHFKKPLTKIDVLKAPDTYPCPLNVYCVQEISINWCLYGGSDFGNSQFGKNDDQMGDQVLSVSPASMFNKIKTFKEDFLMRQNLRKTINYFQKNTSPLLH